MRYLSLLNENQWQYFKTIVVFFIVLNTTTCQRVVSPIHKIEFGHSIKASGFVLWLSQNATHTTLLVFDRDTNQDGKIEVKLGEHGEPLADQPRVAWIQIGSQFPNKTKTKTDTKIKIKTENIEFYDALITTDEKNRFAVLKKNQTLFLIDTLHNTKIKLEGAQGLADTNNPCLPSREAAFDPASTRVVYPIGDQHYRSLNLNSKQTYDVKTNKLLWRVRPNIPNQDEVWEIIEDSDGDGLKFPRTKSTCVCDWCRRFARSVGNYGSEGDLISHYFYDSSQKEKTIKRKTTCEILFSSQTYDLEKCKDTYYRYHRKLQEKNKLSVKVKMLKGALKEIDGWIPLLVIGKQGLRMGRYDLENNTFENGPFVKNYASQPSPGGFWVGTGKKGVFSWSIKTGESRFHEMKSPIHALDGLILHSKNGVYLVDPTRTETLKLRSVPTLISENGCAIYRDQSHRIQKSPWSMECTKDPIRP